MSQIQNLTQAPGRRDVVVQNILLRFDFSNQQNISNCPQNKKFIEEFLITLHNLTQ